MPAERQRWRPRGGGAPEDSSRAQVSTTSRPLRLLVTGVPGVGKTTLCKKVFSRLREPFEAPDGDGPKAQFFGFLGEERREGGKRVGFDMVALDGSQRAPLAITSGPETEHMVGRYRVQLGDFEGLTFPILDAAIDGGTAQRVLIFDEIGKMELFSTGFMSRVSAILRCPEASLHVLGTVAKNGGGFIKASKGLDNVEVLEIDESSRDAECDRVAERFAAALRAGGTGSVGGATPPVGAAPAEGVVETAATPPAKRPASEFMEAPKFSEAPAPAAEAAAEAATTPPTKRPSPEVAEALEAPEGSEAMPVQFNAAALKVRFDNPGKGKFSSIYLKGPSGNFASVNAGDYLLYVGGAAINRAFQEELQACGHEPKDKYVTLHEALLARAKRAPGTLCRLRRGDVFRKPVEADAIFRGRCSYCQQVRECWQARDLPSFARRPHCAECWEYYEDWLFSDLAGFAGLLPEGPLMEPLQPVGVASVAIFPEGRRPRGSDRNVAMVYAIGPNCGGRRKKGRREQDDMSKQDFLSVLERAGGAIAAAVSAHNAGAEEERLPSIDVLRMCLLSGGVYKHPDASKVEVASSLISGLVGLKGGEPRCPCLLDFAFDEDVFRLAWRRLRLPGGGEDVGAEAER